MILKIALTIGVVAVASLPASAEEFYWSHKDWSVSVRAQESEEDNHQICRAWTGGDGEPIVEIQHFTGDAGPPYGYPTLTVNEYAPRHYDTLTQNGDQVVLAFDNGAQFTGNAEADFNGEGLKEAFITPPYDQALSVLQAMRQSDALSITVKGQLLYQASMNGFSAAYGKLAEVCNFSVEGVLD